ncbi:TIGR04282 family arsenosugar biosynthesis glycosyltransferase [Nocardioides dilutus]
MTRALVVAKAPVPGRVKTRLGADVGMVAAAEVAAAALLDTLAACRAAFGAADCLLALSGDLSRAARSLEIEAALAGWHVFPQRGDGLGARLAHAHADAPGGRPVLQVGMDTPQLAAEHLHGAAATLDEADALLGPAEDGGWWLLGLRDPAAAAALIGVPMSTPTTYDDTRRALEDVGLEVATGTVLRDVDTVADADLVAAGHRDTEFARAWTGVVGR